MFHQKTLHKMWCMSRHIVMWSCQSPVAHSCGLLNHPNSFSGGIFKLNAKFDADLLFYSVILYTTDTQYRVSLNGPHWLVQWSHHYSCIFQYTLSLATRLHWCHTICSHYISTYIIYVYIAIYIVIYILLILLIVNYI